MKKTPKAFITYSHKNTAKRAQFETALGVMKQNDEIKIWCDAEILPGDKWEPEIAKKLKESDILLYLVSADSLASKNCNKELTDILSKESNIRIIPIILEHCDFQHHYLLAGLEVLPEKNKAISRWRNHNEAWQNVVEGIRRIIASIPCKPQGEPDTIPSTPKGLQSTPLTMEQEAAEFFNRANFFSMLGNNDLAIVEFNKAIALNPNHAASYNNRGIVYGKQGKYDLAITDFNKVIELNSNLEEAYNNRGNAYNGKGKYDLAIDDCNKAIELNPNYAEAYSNRGNVYNSNGKYDLALADCNKAIELDPNYAGSHNNRGIAYNGKGKYDRAIADYNKAIELSPNYASLYYNRGIAYNGKGKHDLAIADYNKAIALNSNYAEAYNNRGVTKSILQDLKGTREDLETALRLAKQQKNKIIVDDIQKKIDQLPAAP